MRHVGKLLWEFVTSCVKTIEYSEAYAVSIMRPRGLGHICYLLVKLR